MLELRILTGLHRGAALPLEGDTIRLGSGKNNDIVLLDPGMPECAAVICRSAESAWQYSTCASALEHGSLNATTVEQDGSSVVPGARWFAGPVLVGCEEESEPWRSEHAALAAPPPRRRGLSLGVKLTLAAMAAATAVGAVALLLVQSEPPHAASPSREHSAATAAPQAPQAPQAPPTPPTPQPTQPTLRVVSATIHPPATIAPPPFAIRSASGGAYGFIVTDDGRVLVPGNRWRAFTLVRIEPGRAIFSGPHAAELIW